MEKSEGSSCTSGEKTRKGVFTIPSVSDIKRANKISVITSVPTLFNQHRTAPTTQHAASGTTILPPPTTANTTAEASSEPNRPNSGTTSQWLAGRRDEDQNTVVEGSRKRPREDPEHSVGVLMKLAAGANNERVLPQLGGNMKEPPITPTIGGSVGELMSGGRAVMAASEGAATSASSSTSVATVHHPHAIIANRVQKKNPVMKHIRNIPWELGDIVPDFLLGRTTCALFLSVRYHSLHPNYIHTRLKELGKQYQLRLLLVLVDMKECQKVLQELAKIAVLADLTLMLAWSYEEAGRYLETYKSFENKPPDMLMERIDSDFLSRATECLTTVKKVNKTDAATLLNNFKSIDKVITASREDLVLCPGLGPQKAQRLHSLFHQPFKTASSTKSD